MPDEMVHPYPGAWFSVYNRYPSGVYAANIVRLQQVARDQLKWKYEDEIGKIPSSDWLVEVSATFQDSNWQTCGPLDPDACMALVRARMLVPTEAITDGE